MVIQINFKFFYKLESILIFFILGEEDPVEVVDNVRAATRHSVQDADMEIPFLMKRNLITFQNFKIN